MKFSLFHSGMSGSEGAALRDRGTRELYAKLGGEYHIFYIGAYSHFVLFYCCHPEIPPAVIPPINFFWAAANTATDGISPITDMAIIFRCS